MNKLVFLLLFLCVNCFSQDATVFKPDSIKRKLVATEIKNTLKIDGILNDKEWQLSQNAEHFIEIEPFQGNIANNATTVKVLFNKHYL